VEGKNVVELLEVVLEVMFSFVGITMVVALTGGDVADNKCDVDFDIPAITEVMLNTEVVDADTF
jgi:hypothetical protein